MKELKVTTCLLAIVIGLMCGCTTTPNNDGKTHDDTKRHVFAMEGDLKWQDGPPSLPKGAKFAVIEGDPRKEGPFTLRLKLPSNYKVQPHWHPGDEHVTVVSGTFNMALGEKFDDSKGKALPAGSFAVMNIGTRHFAWTTNEETVIQLHGNGPWGINYVNPKDDPRNK